jgi:hypothetical protein
MKPMPQEAWMLWFTPRDPKSHAAFGQSFTGTHAQAVAEGNRRAGKTYTVSIKGTSPTKPIPQRRHARP